MPSNPKFEPSTVDIVKWRTALNLTQSQFAFMVKVSHRTIERWVKGNPQAPWFKLALKGAVGKVYPNAQDTVDNCNWGGYGSRDALIEAYNVAVGNKKVKARKQTTDAMDLESL